jgi:hypothetical protein
LYQFLLNLWVMKEIDETRIQNAVTQGYISQAEADMILATPQIPAQ